MIYRKWTIPDSEPCSCNKCQDMCRRPCWPLPEEIEGIISAGFGDRLMVDYWCGGFEPEWMEVDIISPALQGSEGGRSPWWPTGKCTFLDEDNLCELHGICKPYEGRISRHDNTHDQHEIIARCWDSPEGRAAVALWNNKDHR